MTAALDIYAVGVVLVTAIALTEAVSNSRDFGPAIAEYFLCVIVGFCWPLVVAVILICLL